MRRERSASRREAILAVFTRHVAERGYDGTNFSELAAELGISKGTIVHHFGTKHGLLRELHESYMRRRLAEARLLVERLRTPAEQIAALAYAFVLAQVRDRSTTLAFQREIVRFADDPMMSEVRRMRDEHREVVEGVLRAGMASEAFRPGDARLQGLLFAGSAQSAWTWFDPGGPRSAEEIGGALVDLVVGGLLVDRTGLGRLADPGGPIPGTVRRCMAEVAARPPRAPGVEPFPRTLPTSMV
ncbi:MAG: TetR/AcrR family transcriptional regulator [Carbonactinosporaceae bacterium]